MTVRQWVESSVRWRDYWSSGRMTGGRQFSSRVLEIEIVQLEQFLQG